MYLKNKSKEFQNGYMEYHQELIELLKKTEEYHVTLTQLAKMLVDFTKDRAKDLVDTGNFKAFYYK